MSETINCPYGDNCPQVITNRNSIELLAQKIDLQNQHINEKMDSISSDVKEVKDFLNEGLDKKIDERIEAAWNKKVASLTKWIVTSVIGSSGLTALITLLIK